MSTLEGNPMGHGCHRALGDSFWDGAVWHTLRMNWPLWSCVHVLTFTLVPLRFR
eukprot:CAMPEP_0171290008 /NCGR_PEP_ID=MMETSP0790-20130122/70914_1 /TAXON_ID=2925 /ORGANISM="Alexandrium catenella, Strain OF101" /LENGTH=53 /DNA_ID=CAMNT_0011759685 /DNA_START=43 /DNA_END=200 /DNA_ORIENTATION=-